MIGFFYGSDTYRSKQKLMSLKKEFIRRKDQRGLNVSTIEGANLTLDELRKIFLSPGLFTQKRLLIINGILSQPFSKKILEEKEELFKEILRIVKKTRQDKENSLIFWDEEIKEKLLNILQKKLYQTLKKEKYAEEFKLLKGLALKNWLKKQLIDKGFQIENQAIDLLINTHGDNLWLLKNEFDKLIAWQLSCKKNRKICFSDIQSLILPKTEQDIWRLVDALGQKNKINALKILSDQFKNGVDISKIITLLAHQYRTILRIKSYLQNHRVFNQYQLAKILSLHPFVCQKGMAQEKNYTLEELKKIYQQLLKIDFLRKTRKIDSEMLLDLLIIKSLPS
ncbi:DNA polymerase III subunit delta [Patescibacteria group bacterium]|nr:DNA polymerase III subunit delta [Patescibacteria group bacterium]